VPSREPGWWYRTQPSLIARALAPVASVYGAIAVRRIHKAPSYRSPIPVVCIGNFTAGGTGKTPFALWLAERLQTRGLSVVFLTRGYGSTVRTEMSVDLSRHSAAEVGDEAMLLARAGPVMVSPDRAAGAKAILAEFPSAAVILMDDGLQNPALHKDLSIAIVDGARGFGNGRIIPAGPLRAPLAPQLARTDVIVVNGRREDRDAIERALAPEFSGPILSAWPEPAGATGWLNGVRVVAFAGIGNPARFFRLLEAAGAVLVARHAFADHHNFTDAEATRLISEAQTQGAQLVTTEKDLVRLVATDGPRAKLHSRAHPLAITLNVEADGEDVLIGKIVSLCGLK
jgi:tetraacyldisaccharide 4'-kinase